jgi:hypothetical protein
LDAVVDDPVALVRVEMPRCFCRRDCSMPFALDTSIIYVEANRRSGGLKLMSRGRPTRNRSVSAAESTSP